MRHLFLFIAFSIGVGSTAAQGQDPIVLRQMGSFHVGGRLIEITGQPIKDVMFTPGGVPARMDPNGKYQVEQMYVQYFLPQHRKGKMPLLLWHGGGLTGVTYETKPDGGEGWLNFFIRQGWDTYISDAVERGRASWTNTFKGDPVFLPFGDPWERFRIGPPGSWNNEKDKRTTYPGAQFPTAAYEQFMKQAVPRWLTTDDQIVAAYVELVDKVCPCVVLVHSQSGAFGFKSTGGATRKGQGLGCGRADTWGRPQQGRLRQEHAGPYPLRRQREGPSALVENPPERRRVRGLAQVRRRPCRCDRSSRARGKGQFTHDDDG